jgi:lipopolysaccharide transport system permease protein
MMLGFNRSDLRITFNLFKMNIRDRYLGSRVGMCWSVINPLLMLGMYVFVFGFIFKSKLPGSSTSLSFVIWLISGYAPWMAISEGLSTATTSIVSGVSLVKNIVFKTELLPIAATLVGLFPMAIGLIILLLLLIVEGTGLSWNILWLLLLIPLQVAFLTGLGFFLSALNVFIRDIAHMLTSVLMLLLFFTPIFYTKEQMPEIIQKITFFNPFYQITQAFRLALVHKSQPDSAGILYLVALTALLWWAGLKLFRKLKGYFESCL